MSEAVTAPDSLALGELIDARRDEFQLQLDRYGATILRLFGSVARGTTSEGSDNDILVEIDPAEGNLLMRTSGLMEETRSLFGRGDIDVLPVQLLKRPISATWLKSARELWSAVGGCARISAGSSGVLVRGGEAEL